jgi:hypothetical protein
MAASGLSSRTAIRSVNHLSMRAGSHWRRRTAADSRSRHCATSTSGPSSDFVKAYGHNGYFKSLKEIVHFYNTRDVLPRCAPHDPREGTGCWPAPETTENVNKSKTGNLNLTEQEENALAAFMQTLTDGYAPAQK